MTAAADRIAVQMMTAVSVSLMLNLYLLYSGSSELVCTADRFTHGYEFPEDAAFFFAFFDKSEKRIEDDLVVFISRNLRYLNYLSGLIPESSEMDHDING